MALEVGPYKIYPLGMVVIFLVLTGVAGGGFFAVSTLMDDGAEPTNQTDESPSDVEQVSEPSISIISPGQQPSTDFNYEVDISYEEAATYTVFLDSRELDSGSLSGPEILEGPASASAGQHQFVVEVDTGGQTYREVREINVQAENDSDDSSGDGQQDSSTDSGDDAEQDNTTDENQTGEDETDETTSVEYSLEFQEELIQNQQNALIVNRGGERFSDVQVSINNEGYGTTDSDGELTLTVPETSEITVSIDAENFTDRTFQVGTPSTQEEMPADIDFVDPSDGEELDDWKKEFVAGIEAEDDLAYSVKIDGRTVYSASVGAGDFSSFRETQYIEKSGSHTWKIVVESGGSTYESEEKSFTTTESIPPITINDVEPSEGQEIQDYEVYFNYSVDSPVPYNFTLDVDGETMKESSLDADQSLTSHRQVFSNTGEHSWRLFANSTVTLQQEEVSRSFSTTEEPPIGEFGFMTPAGNANPPPTSDDQIKLEFAFENYEDVDYTVYLVKDGGSQTIEGEGSLTEEKRHVLNTTPRTFEAATYDWWVEVESIETEDTITSETQTFEVEPS